MIFSLLLLFVGSIYFAATRMDFILFPSKGVEVFFIRTEGELGDSLQLTSKKIQAFESFVAELPPAELDTFTSQVGLIQEDPNDPQTKRGSHFAQVKVQLTPEDDRTRSVQAIIDELREKTKTISGFTRIDFDKQRMGPPVGKPIEIRITGDDYKPLKLLALQVQEHLQKIPGVTDIKDDYQFDKDELDVRIDAVKAAQTGLTVQTIANTIKAAFDGQVATSIKSTEEEVLVKVKYPEALKSTPLALENLVCANTRGALIPLNHVARFEPSKRVSSLYHFDGERTIHVSANIDESQTTAMAVSQTITPTLQELESQHPGFRLRFGGEVEETQKSLNNLLNAFYLAAGLILLILIAMFKSLRQSFIVMLNIPFSLIGVVIAFYLHNEPLSFMAILGVIGLAGVVVDAAVLMIDFINKLREAGMEMTEAILEGSALRLRAVILTSVTTFFGVLPTAYGLGGSDPFITPMALALNYGIVFGSIVTLMYVPLLVAAFDKKGAREIPTDSFDDSQSS